MLKASELNVVAMIAIPAIPGIRTSSSSGSPA